MRVNAYERDPRTRLACVRHFGCRCSVCDLSFEERYGEAGRDLIHVHHLKPLSLADDVYDLDPVEDLRPVCPNRHAMLHRREPRAEHRRTTRPYAGRRTGSPGSTPPSGWRAAHRLTSSTLRLNGRPLRSMLVRLVVHEPHRPLPHLWGIPCPFVHGSNLSTIGASGNPGAIQNYDWFNYWLLGGEDRDPTKAEQYARWGELRKLRKQQSAGAGASTDPGL